MLLYEISVLIFFCMFFSWSSLTELKNNKNFCIADLIQCTNEMNVNIPQLADSLFERTTNSSWVVVFKSLITTHHLMVYGNEVIEKMMCLRIVIALNSYKCQPNASTNDLCKKIFIFTFLYLTLHEHRSHYMFVYLVPTLKSGAVESKGSVLNAGGTFFFGVILTINKQTKKPTQLN